MKKVTLFPVLPFNSKAPIDNVMIVDDDEVCHFIISKNIETARFATKIVAINSGEEALTELSACCAGVSRFPDVIFLDINMPQLTGWEFLDKYAKLPQALLRQTRVIMLSSSDCEEDTGRAELSKHVFDYIVKPISIKKLDTLWSKINAASFPPMVAALIKSL